MSKITQETSVAEIVRDCPNARRIFDKYGLKGCGGEHGPAEPISFFANVHNVDPGALVGELNAEMLKAAPEEYVSRESIADTIYRRFFKAGIAIMLSIGGLWGAINLVQISLGENFVQLRLVPSIHAHAHAMIFGWVGLFVMGFAYQSFPRFKHTMLWRAGLANLTLFLMIAGIAARVAAELLQPAIVGLVLGGLSAAAELAAVSLFIAITLKTARQSMEPPKPYEKFIFAALFWFFTQAILSHVFFFAKATAAGAQQVIARIALIDGPLRDIQLLGFAALIIAGVSQRFVPVVYGLRRPKRDRQTLIFWLINGSLLLDVASYVLLVSTGALIFALGLEISYLLMVAWAILLVIQLGVFSRPSQTDRSFKFIRAAYSWLLFAMAMMPFFLVYGLLSGQGFAHSYLGAHRHAFTAGFISMMIVGVASRVTPILAGLDSKHLSSLWGPFILLNVGNASRVGLEILTDSFPNVSYRLVGFTGFMEIAAFAWWATELWHTMNLSKTHRAKLLRAPATVVAH